MLLRPRRPVSFGKGEIPWPRDTVLHGEHMSKVPGQQQINGPVHHFHAHHHGKSETIVGHGRFKEIGPSQSYATTFLHDQYVQAKAQVGVGQETVEQFDQEANIAV